MAGVKQIKTALVSVFHKDGLEALLAKLHSEGVKFLSTGGTQRFIESLGYECQTVESVTSYPSILGGRVKTLHPKVFGGILARRENEGDRAQMQQYDIPAIDLVVRRSSATTDGSSTTILSSLMMMVLAVPKSIAISWIKEKNPISVYVLFLGLNADTEPPPASLYHLYFANH